MSMAAYRRDRSAHGVVAALGLRRATIPWLAALGLLLLFDHVAWAQHFHFDPASCKHNTGHMYVALGRSVIAVPARGSGVAVVNPLGPKRPHLKAPDPAEPVGCFGNPMQSGSYELFWSSTLTGIPCSATIRMRSGTTRVRKYGRGLGTLVGVV